MHLHDGVIDPSAVAVGFAVSAGLFAWSAYRVRDEEIPRIAVLTAAFFVASLIHIPAGPSSVHLTLNGLTGILLRRRAFLAFPVGLFLQVTLGHGGLTVIGVNACIFGFPALASWLIYDLLSRHGEKNYFLSGAISGALAVFLSGLMLGAVLWLSSEEFKGFAEFVFIAHIPLMIMEGIITGFVIQFLARVQPSLVRKGAS